MKGFIAVDGGGSKTELVLFDEEGKIYIHKLISCTNPNDIGMDEAFNKLDFALKEMLEISANSKLELKGIFLGIAGIEFGDSKQVLSDKLIKSLDYENIHIDGDLASVKELGLGKVSDGVVVISGTGFNMAVKNNNEFKHIGGWGYLADDYLSGFDLGKEALISASNSIDKTGEKTILVDMLQKHYNSSLWYAMARIYKEGIKGVASLSKLVLEAYKKEDKVARNIVDKRVNKLVDIISNNTREIKKPLKVALLGGIFQGQELVTDLLKAKLGGDYNVVVENKKTIYGAVGLAMKLNGVLSTDSFFAEFENNYKQIIKS